jgi:hypothetical protein
MLAALLLAVVLSWLLSPWFLLAVPFAVGGAFAMWVGLSNQEAVDAFGAWGDSGSGPAGLAP